MHRHGGEPLLQPELAAMYDAFETPRAVRGDLPLLDRAQALDYLADGARAACSPCSASRGAGDGVLLELSCATSSSTARRCCRRSSSPRLLPAPALARAPRPGAAGGHTGLEPVEVPGGPCTLGAGRRRLRLRQRAPAPRRRRPRLPHRPHAGHQRHLADLRRGRRLRAPRVVDATRAGRGRRTTTSRTRGLGPRARGMAPVAAGRLGAAGPRRARGPRVLVRGRRLRPRARRPPPHRGRVGEGGDLGPGRRRRPGATRGATRRPPATHANLDQRGVRPRTPPARYPAGASPCGALGMLGDVWEWTASDFRGYPGFVAHPYREYSEVFFGRGYKVLRGGSWAQRATVATADVPQLGPPAAPPDLLRRAAGVGRLGLPPVADDDDHQIGYQALPRGVPVRQRPTARRSARSTACSTTRASTSSTAS